MNDKGLLFLQTITASWQVAQYLYLCVSDYLESSQGLEILGNSGIFLRDNLRFHDNSEDTP